MGNGGPIKTFEENTTNARYFFHVCVVSDYSADSALFCLPTLCRIFGLLRIAVLVAAATTLQGEYSHFS